jgi:V8-like Glu-specific endopeptidase|uniref:Serine protease n=1 Tax=Bionectria ochroleuca TaxID=29856 RepID=A0A8H7TPK5_BIOOC
MLGLLPSAVTALLLSRAAGTPVAPEVKVSNLLGYDPSFVRPLSADDIIPEITYLSAEDIAHNATLSGLEPLIPEGTDTTEVNKRYINGADDRYVYSDTSYPWAATGKLYWSNGVWCSGALVGPRHVLTAKHCLTSGATGYFAPGFDNGARFGEGVVTVAVTTDIEWGTPCGWKGDWAILIINRRLGDERGYFGAKYPDASLVDQPIFNHIGYPGDRDSGNRPYRTNGNTVQSFRAWDCDSTGPFYTDTDTMGGQSGGPHWQNVNGSPYIWGTLSVTFGSGTVAWAGWGSGDGMVSTIGRLRAEYP